MESSQATNSAATARRLKIADELLLPMQKSIVAQQAVGSDGAREFRLFYGSHEIDFDEPELFGFAETLAKMPRFFAGDAMHWGGTHSWPAIQKLLEDLISQGILHFADEAETQEYQFIRPDDRPSPLPAAKTGTAHSWAEGEPLMELLTGHPLEIGYLELVVPIFRVAHPALDAENRQIGEANVFPKSLRLDVQTHWRTCTHQGSRYQAERPMNLSALKAMRVHWGQMMTVLAKVREAYLERFPAARAGWTVGHLERLSTLVLALPTYLIMKTHDPVKNGTLHPVLSNVFRVTDGLRMTLHQMLFVPIGEPAWAADAPVTGAEIHAYAERNYSFHSETGVCAGPQMMVEEFLSVLVDGSSPRNGFSSQLDPQVQAALDQMEPAIDYGLLGLQSYAVVFSLWPEMTRSYEALSEVAETWAAKGSPRAKVVRDRLAKHVAHIRLGSYLGDEPKRTQRDAVYQDMYAECGRGLTGQVPALGLDSLVKPAYIDQALMENLHKALKVSIFSDADQDTIKDLSDVLADFLTREQAILRLGAKVQASINILLGRPQPVRPLSALDVDLHNRLLGEDLRRLPYLPTELKELLGIDVLLDQERIVVQGGTPA